MIFRRAQREFLRGLDAPAIEAAIREAEARTTGEIRVTVLPRLRGGLARAVEPAARRLGMTGTKERNGVLILVAPHRKEFLVWGDVAIHEKVGETFWKDVASAIEERFRAADFTGGLLAGIRAAGRALETHFPSAPSGHANELPDGLDVS